MSATECTLWSVAQIFGKTIPPIGRRGYCPFRKHKRSDKSLTVFVSRSGEPLFKCHSCDPPYNVGDAVALYAAFLGIDRGTAWRELRDRGYAVPGLDRSYRPRPEQVPRRPLRLPVQGERIDNVLHFDQGKWGEWAAKDRGGRAAFAEQRGLALHTLVTNDVVDVSDGLIGFGYRDPVTRVICRVKMRPLDRKTYWIEPKPKKGERGKAVGPLYLADKLTMPRGLMTYVVITEGEVDALTLKDQGIPNTVSLPDGAGSASRVDLAPISRGFCIWFVATDEDEEGEQAYSVLNQRGRHVGVRVARVHWRLGEQTFKDANDALLGGFGPQDFVRCVQDAAEIWLGHRMSVAV